MRTISAPCGSKEELGAIEHVVEEHACWAASQIQEHSWLELQVYMLAVHHTQEQNS